MTVFRAALGCHKIVFSVYLVHMRTFEVTSARAFPYTFARRKLPARCNVDPALDNSALALVVLTVAEKVHISVIIEKE